MDLSQGANINRGYYSTACEKSPNRNLIDQWINEGKSNSFISRQLENLGEKISDKSVAKYRQYRDEHLQKELMKDPNYQSQIQLANRTLVEEVGKFQQINVVNHLAETIQHCAELVEQSKLDDIKIKSVQDLRFVQMTMLESLKIYTDTIMKAQQFQKIEDDPTLIKPTVNVNVKNVLIDMLGNMSEDQKFKLIDGIRGNVGGGNNDE